LGRPGPALENAVIEIVALHLEFELRSLQHFATRAQARAAVAARIEDYNTRRRHSACQKLPPAAYEQLLAERGK
jgi:putative transposase